MCLLTWDCEVTVDLWLFLNECLEMLEHRAGLDVTFNPKHLLGAGRDSEVGVLSE